jgi:hypothetical protein
MRTKLHIVIKDNSYYQYIITQWQIHQQINMFSGSIYVYEMMIVETPN